MKILIADDENISRLTLEAFLKRWGYEVSTASDGRQAWQAFQSFQPDLAIIDWEMPYMDGIEICQKVRLQEGWPYIYLIMLTAKTEDSDMILGLQAGADDYILKPYSSDILKSRLAVGDRTIKYERRLAEQNQKLQKYSSEMEQLVEQRSRQLVHTERIATVGLLSAGIAHEINNPMTFISGNIQTLDRIWKDVAPLLREAPAAASSSHRQVDFALKHVPNILAEMKNGTQRISRIISGLKAFCRKEEGKPKPCNLNQCIEHALTLCHNTLKYHVAVETHLLPDLPQVSADEQQIEQVLVNLLMNAADAIREANPKQGIIDIETGRHDEKVFVQIKDNGTGIPPEKLNDVWQPFYTTKPIGKGTGLGLSISMGIIENHRGTIRVANNPEHGACFTISLPLLPTGVTHACETADC